MRNARDRFVATSELRRRPAAIGAPSEVTLCAYRIISRGSALIIARPMRIRDAQQSAMRSDVTQDEIYCRTNTNADETMPSGPAVSMLMSSTYIVIYVSGLMAEAYSRN